MNLRSFLTYHAGAIVLSLCIAIAVVLPQCVAVWEAGSSFKGIYPQTQDDAQYYLARIQEVYDGHTTLAQPFLYEGKDGMPLQFWIPDVVVSRMGMLLSLNAQQVLIFSDAFFPFILALLTYALLYELTKRRSTAVFGTAFLYLGLFLELFGRPISPQVTFVPMLGFLLALFFVERTGSRRAILAAGILFGLLFHTYAYHWMYATVLMGMYLFFSVALRRWEAVKTALRVTGIGFLIGIPYFLQFFQTLRLDSYHDTLMRLGMLTTHVPSGALIVGLSVLYVLGCGVLLLFRKKTFILDNRFVLVSAMVLAVPIVANQHLITGQNLEFSSHYRTLGIFVTLFGLAFLSHRFMGEDRSRRVRMALACVSAGMICFSLWSVYGVVRTDSHLNEAALSWQRYAPVFSWLSANTEKDSVVYANGPLSSLIPAYTADNVFYAREANMHFMSAADVEQRYLLSTYFEPAIGRDALVRDERALFGTYYINRDAHISQENKLRALLGFSPVTYERYPEPLLQQLVVSWRHNALSPFRALVSEYRLDYILWDKKANPEWQYKLQAAGLTRVYESGDFIVYKL